MVERGNFQGIYPENMVLYGTIAPLLGVLNLPLLAGLMGECDNLNEWESYDQALFYELG